MNSQTDTCLLQSSIIYRFIEYHISYRRMYALFFFKLAII